MSVYKKIEMLVRSKALPHAVVFEGENSNAVSEYFAKCVVCSGENKPCGECRDCKKAEKGVHPDIIKLYPSGVMKNYPIEEIRRIKEDAYVLPNEAENKVYIFNDVDNISAVSQNALLKILEEPPTRVVFVLNCKSKTHLLDTIISRATVFYVGENTDVKNEDLSNAFDIINTAVFEPELELLIRITALSADREKRLNTILEIQSALRLLYRIKSGAENNTDYDDLLENLTVHKILEAIDITEEVRLSTLRNKSVKITLARFCAGLKAVLGR